MFGCRHNWILRKEEKIGFKFDITIIQTYVCSKCLETKTIEI